MPTFFEQNPRFNSCSSINNIRTALPTSDRGSIPKFVPFCEGTMASCPALALNVQKFPRLCGNQPKQSITCGAQSQGTVHDDLYSFSATYCHISCGCPHVLSNADCGISGKMLISNFKALGLRSDALLFFAGWVSAPTIDSSRKCQISGCIPWRNTIMPPCNLAI